MWIDDDNRRGDLISAKISVWTTFAVTAVVGPATAIPLIGFRFRGVLAPFFRALSAPALLGAALAFGLAITTRTVVAAPNAIALGSLAPFPVSAIVTLDLEFRAKPRTAESNSNNFLRA
jgi:hypothetical protein